MIWEKLLNFESLIENVLKFLRKFWKFKKILIKIWNNLTKIWKFSYYRFSCWLRRGLFHILCKFFKASGRGGTFHRFLLEPLLDTVEIKSCCSPANSNPCQRVQSQACYLWAAPRVILISTCCVVQVFTSMSLLYSLGKTLIQYACDSVKSALNRINTLCSTQQPKWVGIKHHWCC